MRGSPLKCMQASLGHGSQPQSVKDPSNEPPFDLARQGCMFPRLLSPSRASIHGWTGAIRDFGAAPTASSAVDRCGNSHRDNRSDHYWIRTKSRVLPRWRGIGPVTGYGSAFAGNFCDGGGNHSRATASLLEPSVGAEARGEPCRSISRTEVSINAKSPSRSSNLLLSHAIRSHVRRTAKSKVEIL